MTALGLHAVGCDVDVIAAIGGHARCHATGGLWRFAAKVGTAELARETERTMQRERYDIVCPTTEPLQHRLWSRRSEWPGLVLPTVDAVPPVHFADKRQMSYLARDAGVAIPDQVDRARESDIDEAIRRLGLPIVIKGAVGRGGRTTFIAASSAQARDAIRRVERRGTERFAQRYVPGPTFLVGGVFHEGLPLRLYAGEKRLQLPPRTGPAAVLISRDDPALVQSATRVFRAARLSGLASADFVRDPAGQFHFLELNPRPWGSIAAARDAGVDLFTPLIQLWQGIVPPADLRFRTGVRTAVFPLAALSRAAWASGDAWRSIAGVSSAALAHPALTWHLARRAVRVARNW